MILKIQLCFVLIVACINKAACASISKVYFHRSDENLPLEYYQYGAPGLEYTSPQIAQLSAAPVNSMVPADSGYVAPCAPPCVYPGQTIASFAPAPSSVNQEVPIKSNQSPVPSVPVITKYWNDPTIYEYAYVVYDQNTGDKKLQSESSDGSVVRGEYSFLQPDGYVRNVQYEADDLRGFNAIVTNYLPVTGEETKVETAGEINLLTPYSQVISEQLRHIATVSETETSSKEKPAFSLEPTTNNQHIHENHFVAGLNKPQETHGEASEKSEGKVHEGSQGNAKAVSTEIHNTNNNEGYETKLTTIQKPTETLTDTSILVPYKDIVKCIETLLNKATTVQNKSPLACIVLNIPC